MEAHLSAYLASLEAQSRYSESTRLAYSSDLRIFFDYLRKKLKRSPKLEDLTVHHVADFLDAERQAGRRQSTLIRRWASLRRFVEYLSQRHIISGGALEANNHLIDRVISKVSPAPPSSYLADIQIKGIQDVIEASPRLRARRDQAILALLVETGLSVGTLVDLDLSDLDLDAKKIHITTEAKQDLWLPLDNATEHLKQYLSEGRPDLNPKPDESALFVSQMGSRMSRQGIWQILQHWGRRVQPPVNLSPRLLRHTAALRLARSGRTLAEIQALLGHSNPLSTQALLRRLKSTNKGN